jgi:hypothetical protein
MRRKFAEEHVEEAVIPRLNELSSSLPPSSTFPERKSSPPTKDVQRTFRARETSGQSHYGEQGGGRYVDEALSDSFVRNAHRSKLIKGYKWGSLEDD